MKKSICIICGILFHLMVFSQTSSGIWNENTATYSNSRYGISWTLIEGVQWKERPILSNSTLFKVRNDDALITVSLGVQPVNSKDDIWNNISLCSSNEFMSMAKEEAKRNDCVLQYVKPIRSQICGKHAIKVKIDMNRYYPEYGETIHRINHQYYVVLDECMYTLNILGLFVGEDELTEFDKIATIIVDGFKFVGNVN